jgi:hypothetical protein
MEDLIFSKLQKGDTIYTLERETDVLGIQSLIPLKY